MLIHDPENWVNFIVLAGFIIPIVLHDIREKRIPDVYTCSGCTCLFLIRFLFFHNYLILIDTVIGYIIIWLLWFFTKGRIGRGDAKLSALMALGLGLIGWVFTLFWASFTGLICSLILLKFKKINKKEGIPFAPFLAVGGLISFFTKDFMMRLYNVFQ